MAGLHAAIGVLQYRRKVLIYPQAIIENLMTDAKYPKERDQRLIEMSKATEHQNTMRGHKGYMRLCQVILLDEFPNLTIQVIKAVLASELTLTKAHEALTAVADGRPSKRRRRNDLADPEPYSSFPQDLVDFVMQELADARSEQTRQIAEILSRDPGTSQPSGGTIECACCFDDAPAHQVAHCDGYEPHYFCRSCTAQNVKTQIEYRKSRVRCMDGSQCEANFADHQLRLALDTKTLQRLERLRQQDDLKESGIEGLAGG